jgi:hypothetical protein
MQSTVAITKYAAGLRNPLMDDSTDAAIHSASPNATTPRIAQRPPVCKNDSTHQLCAPIHL